MAPYIEITVMRGFALLFVVSLSDINGIIYVSEGLFNSIIKVKLSYYVIHFSLLGMTSGQ